MLLNGLDQHLICQKKEKSGGGVSAHKHRNQKPAGPRAGDGILAEGASSPIPTSSGSGVA